MVKAFLSHSSNDKELVQQVQKILTSANSWYDAVDIENGDSIPDRINEGLKTATHYVLFWSENARKSRWVQAELNAAFCRMMADKCKFMIFVLDNTDVPTLLQSYKYDRVNKSSIQEAASFIARKILSQDGADTSLSKFINRTSEIGVIEEAVRSDCRIIVLSGILGIGKLSIAKKAFHFLYPNRASNRIVIDFERIPGIAELSLELSRKANADFLNDNQDEEKQAENIRYFIEVLSAKNSLLVFKDVKNWLQDNGELSLVLRNIVNLIIKTEMFNSVVFITTSRYITGLETYGTRIRQIRITGLSDQHTAEIINNNLPLSYPSNREKNLEFAKRLYGYPLAAKLAANEIANSGYNYYLAQPQKILSLKVSLAKELITYAKLTEECKKYLEIMAICKSRLLNEEYVEVFPDLKDSITRLADEAYFAGVVRFNDDNCYQLEAIVEDYFYDLAFALPDRKELCNTIGAYLEKSLKVAPRNKYLRIVPVAVHVLSLANKFKEALALRTELVETIVSSMWDKYNHMEFEEALSTANSLIEYDDLNLEAKYVKALCLTRFDKYVEADKLLRSLLDADTTNRARYYYALGRIQKRQCNYPKAIELFDMSIYERPRYLSPYREMAECYLLMEDLQEAEKCILKACDIDDSNIFVILLEARLAQKQGNPEYSIKILESETILNQAPEQVLFRKGRAYDQLGNVTEACRCYTESLKYNPKMYDAALCLLSHQVLSNPSSASDSIEELKQKLYGKRKAVLINIEARLIGYSRQNEIEALNLLSNVESKYRDRQWYAVKIQLLENLAKRSEEVGRKEMAQKSADDLLSTKKEFEVRFGNDTISEFDLMPDS